MSRKILVIGAVLLLILLGGFFLVRDRFAQTNAGLAIETEPTATVFLEGEQAGTTPFKIERKPGEVTVKLIPFSQNSPLAPYETEVTLMGGIETVVRRSFGPTEDTSSGEVLFFEKIGGRAASVAIVSSPDAAEVSLDGKSVGFTPLKIDAVEIGQHILSLSASGFKPREVGVQTVKGYKLTAVVKLAKLEEEKKEEKKPETKQEVEILTTPTGFLRVREGPSTGATESARVTPGKRYPLLEENEDKTWFKIEYLSAQAGGEGKTGWISAQYTKKIEE